MPRTDAQRRATAKYNRDKVKAVNLRFYPSESDIYAHLAEQPNKQGYVKDLIRADMERRRS